MELNVNEALKLLATAVISSLLGCPVLAEPIPTAAPDKQQTAADPLAAYNVAWDSPSKNSSGSMPIGNGDIGINAWVEPSGDLVFYISKTDAWDENARLCKIGRVRVKLDPPLTPANNFRQELKLKEGCIEIRSPLSGSGGEILLRAWVDANQPVVHVEAEAAIPVTCRAEVELWRLRERPFGPNSDPHSAGGLSGHRSKPVILPDVVVPSSAPRVVWYHRNTRSIFDLSLKVQHLESLQGRFPDPLLNHTFGASLRGDGFAADGALAIKSAAPAKCQVMSVTVLAARTDTPEAWLAQLDQLESKAGKLDAAATRRAHESWWQAFWNRSWVFLNGTPQLGTVTRGYVLQRFMNACSGRGGSPIKFNGSIFTVEAKPGVSPEQPDGDPDWRQWGGNYWFQNTRLAYWPMLATGDLEMMEPWFRMYREALPLSKARMETYYKFTGAASFPETMYTWGMPNNNDYGWNNTAPEPANGYIRRYWSGGIELIVLMLQRYDFTQDEDFARQTLVPLADPIIAFFDQYWPKRDANGKMIMDPAQSLETYHAAVNPLPEVAGLRMVLPRLLGLPDNVTTQSQRTRWTRILQDLPAVPTADVGGVKLLRPADKFSGRANSENTELYAVFPYRLYGVGQPDLAVALASYEKRANRHNRGWCQDSIQAACLGLGEEAARLVSARAGQKHPGSRFPAMWGPNFDWVPDQDHGNNILTTLHFMLLQSDGKKLYLLPAWPKSWDVSFKLHAPYHTTIEAEVRGGKVTSLKVTPPSRAADVVNMLDK